MYGLLDAVNLESLKAHRVSNDHDLMLKKLQQAAMCHALIGVDLVEERIKYYNNNPKIRSC